MDSVKVGCEIEECPRVHKARGYCDMHYQRWKKHGDPLKRGLSPRAIERDVTGYWGIHKRVLRAFGPASLQLCPCGKQAEHWAYDHLDPNEQQFNSHPYSQLVIHYEPLCSVCHKEMDMTFDN